MLNSVYAVLGVCCTRCMLYSVYTVFGVCCTWCMLYSVSTHDHDMQEIERDHLTLCSAMMVEIWTRKGMIRDEVENHVEDMSGYDESGVRFA